MRSYDLIVVGGGPAGSTLACLTKKYNPGRRVLILEQARFPRHHIGESLLPEIVPILKEMGVFGKVDRAGFPRKVGGVYSWGKDGRPWFADFGRLKIDEKTRRAGKLPESYEFAWQVDRSRYDQILLEHAKKSGVEVREGWTAVGIRERADRVCGVTVRDPAGKVSEINSDFLADCSGQGSLMSRYRDVRKPIEALKNVAAYAYFKGARWKYPITGHPNATRIFICSTKDGWFWYIPIGRDITSVGFVTQASHLRREGITDLRALYDRRLRSCEEIWPLLKRARQVPGPGEQKDFFVLKDWSFINTNSAGDGWIAAGDAALFIDPILSSGVLLAQLSAQRAAYTLGSYWRTDDAGVKQNLFTAYSDFYRNCSASFLALATFWYGNDRKAKTWWAEASRVLMTQLSYSLDDRRSLLIVAAGLAANYEKLQQFRSLLFRRDYPWIGTVSQFLGVKKTLKAVPAIKPSDIPTFACDFQVTDAFKLVAKSGTLRPIKELVLLRGTDAQGLNQALNPRLTLLDIHLDLVKRIDGRTDVETLARAAATAYEVSLTTARPIVSSLLQELALLGGIKVHGASDARAETSSPPAKKDR